MRRSMMPSVIARGGVDPGAPPKAPGGACDAAPTRGGVIRRAALCSLYDENDMTAAVRAKVADVHAAFKLPQQDPSKVQSFDPSRGNKSLGGLKGGFKRAEVPPPMPPVLPAAAAEEEEYTFEPLVLWRPPPPEEAESDADGDGDGEEGAGEGGAGEEGEGEDGAPKTKPKPKPKAPVAAPVEVDGFLCRWLRPHQREGVQFCFDCVMGLREYDGAGCILADDMGLGKTLQSIAVLWTVMTQGMTADGQPAVTHTIVACPVSLVTNWESELNKKWIKADRCVAAPEASRQPHTAHHRTSHTAHHLTPRPTRHAGCAPRGST